MKSPRPRFEYDCILRGGSWFNDHTDYFLAHYCSGLYPDDRVNTLGFRCVSLEKDEVAKRFVRIK